MRIMMIASSPRMRKPGFNPASYRYAGTVSIGHISAGGEEYGYVAGMAGGVTPTLLDGRLITRLSWKRKEYHSLDRRELVITLNGTAVPNISNIAVVKDGQLLVEVTVTKGQGTYGTQSYTLIYLTGDVAMPISGMVNVYIK